MKVTDLMIDDWVLAEGKLTQVTDIDELEGINREWIAGCEDGGCIREEDIKPIPLTTDILKKNGFEHEKNVGYVYEDYSSGTKVIVDFWDNTIKIVHNYDIKFNYTYYDNIMVHRFQHILKDLEIEKEIVL